MKNGDNRGRERLALLLIFTSGILWGVIQVFIRALTSYGFSPMQIVFVRMLAATIIFALYMLVKSPSEFKIRLRDLWIFIGTGIVSMVAFNCCYFYTIAQGQSSVGVVLLYTSPVFIMIFSAILLKEKITVMKVFSLAITVLGCALVTGAFSVNSAVPLKVLLAGLASGLLYGLYTIFGKFGLKRYSSNTVTLYTFIFATIGSAPFSSLGQVAEMVSASPISILFAIGIGIVCTIIPYAIYTWGLNYIEPGKAGIIVAIEPIVGSSLGMFAYGESCTWMKISGMVCVIAAIVALNANTKKKQA